MTHLTLTTLLQKIFPKNSSAAEAIKRLKEDLSYDQALNTLLSSGKLEGRLCKDNTGQWHIVEIGEEPIQNIEQLDILADVLPIINELRKYNLQFLLSWFAEDGKWHTVIKDINLSDAVDMPVVSAKVTDNIRERCVYLLCNNKLGHDIRDRYIALIMRCINGTTDALTKDTLTKCIIDYMDTYVRAGFEDKMNRLISDEYTRLFFPYIDKSYKKQLSDYLELYSSQFISKVFAKCNESIKDSRL